MTALAEAYLLCVACMACNREAGIEPCELCAQIEVATVKAGGVASPELRPIEIGGSERK